MKSLVVLALVLIGSPAFASTLICLGGEVYVRAEYEGRAQTFSNVVIAVDNDNAIKFPSAVLDRTYRPRPGNKLIRYNIYDRKDNNTGISLLLPSVKPYGEVILGILVGRNHEYHGEPTYEKMSCSLNR